MRTRWLQFFALTALSTLAGCSADAGTGGEDGGQGNSQGGQSAGGSNSGGFGQGGASSGGSVSQGGTQTGGANSGGASSGGTPGTGGSSSGGSGTTGGQSSGGSAAGGEASGGRASGGASAGGRTGGPGSGGAASGGAASGGATSAAGGRTPIEPGKKFVGNISTGNSIDSGNLVYAKYWDQITPENAGKWGSVQSSASAQFNWTTLDQMYDYAKKNNIIFKQHVFVWGSQQPSGSISEANVKTWMNEFCKRYPDTKIIDVVNEPPPHTTPSYANAIGGGTNGDWKWIINSFKWAREACPNAILVLNDYNNIEWDQDHNHFIDIAKKAKAGGAPIDALGCQAHDAAEKSVAQLQKYLSNMHDQTGLPLYITEYDVSDSNDANQLRIYQQQFPLFYDTEYIHGITIWGWIYGRTWSQAPNSGLVRDGKSRSAMTWLMQQLGRPAP